MTWTSINAPSGWNVTDQECLKLLTYLLLENGNADATGTSTVFSQFTIVELLAVLNDRQRKFMRDVGLVLTRATQGSTPQQSRYQLPTDWLSTERLVWQPQSGEVATTIVLRDSNGQLYNVQVTDAGIFVNTAISTGVVSAPVILRDPATSTSWQMAITTGGLLQPIQLTDSLAYASSLTLFSSSGANVFTLTVANGIYINTNVRVIPLPTHPLERVDAYELDHGMTDWMYQDDVPSLYSEAPLPTLSVDVVKAPSDAGTLGLLYTALPTTLDGTNVKLSVPDEFAHVPVWGALADVLEADAESFDPERAAYAESRYQLGVELAKLMLQGPMAMGGDNAGG